MRNVIENVFQYLLWLVRYTKSIFKGHHGSNIKSITDKVLVCGNGPSIKQVDFDYYINDQYEFLCVNQFALSEELFFKIKPKYYCIVDPYFNTKENEEVLNRLKEVFGKIDWTIYFITVPKNRIMFSNPLVKTIVINSNLLKSSNRRIKYNLYKRNIACSEYQNVIIAALYYLITAKAQKVSLVGVETDFHKELFVGKNNHVYRECVHFYGKETFDLQEKGEIKKGELYKYFYFYYLTLYQYYEMSQYAEYMGVRVVNLCEHSFVDVFEKEELKVEVCDE